MFYVRVLITCIYVHERIVSINRTSPERTFRLLRCDLPAYYIRHTQEARNEQYFLPSLLKPVKVQ